MNKSTCLWEIAAKEAHKALIFQVDLSKLFNSTNLIRDLEHGLSGGHEAEAEVAVRIGCHGAPHDFDVVHVMLPPLQVFDSLGVNSIEKLWLKVWILILYFAWVNVGSCFCSIYPTQQKQR